MSSSTGLQTTHAHGPPSSHHPRVHASDLTRAASVLSVCSRGGMNAAGADPVPLYPPPCRTSTTTSAPHLTRSLTTPEPPVQILAPTPPLMLFRRLNIVCSPAISASLGIADRATVPINSAGAHRYALQRNTPVQIPFTAWVSGNLLEATEDSDETALRSGRRWRRVPAQRRRKGRAAAAQPSEAPPPVAEGAQEGEKGPEEAAAAPAAVPGPQAQPPSVSQFGCNVCLETARDPVVTYCGHLFCWPCLYRWVAVHSPLRDCPVCKSAVEIGPVRLTVSPIYGPPVAGDQERDPDVPPRPRGRRIPRGRSATAVGEVLEEVRRRAEALRRQAQLETIDRTRAAIDRLRANIQAVEGLVREFSVRAAGIGVGQVAVEVEVERVTVTAVPEEAPAEGGAGAERTAGRTRRREGGDRAEDGVYRGTRRRTLAMYRA
ncbi:hypothetical protein Taro_007321, partial [Colocasia esculenta]|nr:hypothetical protein [Colocasia esculenta]